MCAVNRREARYPWMEEALHKLKGKDRLRILRESGWAEDGYLIRDGKRLLNLASNHYLGLPTWLESYSDELQRLCQGGGERGVRIGSGASRLIAGHDPQHAALEDELAKYMKREAALVFSSGYMANVGVIQALVGRHDAVFSDRLNHASIVDGIQLSRAAHYRYSHRDMEQLEGSLKRWAEERPRGGRALIVTDAVFSMDGTQAPLRELIALKERYGAMLMVDEAHSIGVYGVGGRGLAYEEGVHQHVDVIMGTLGKAFGVEGAFIAADELVVHYVVNHARTFIFNTALPPLIAAMLRIRLREVEASEEARGQLMHNAACLRASLEAGGLRTGEGNSHIVPVLLGEDSFAVQISQRLLEVGVAGIAIRPPTVPEKESRIRLTPMAIHTALQMEQASEALIRAIQEG